MEQLCMAVNDGFVALYNKMHDREKRTLLREEWQDISMNDVHIINAVGIGEPRNMSTIARSLSVTVGSLTTAMNGLVKKGYVYRERSAEDRRVIYIRLTDKGIEIYNKHREFHREIVSSIISSFPREDVEMVLRMLEKSCEVVGNQ